MSLNCIKCGCQLDWRENVQFCDDCDVGQGSSTRPIFEPEDSDEYVFITCPGATLYHPGTRKVSSGVEFLDEDNPAAGHRIVGKPVFAPTHTLRRRIKREALGHIRRCQGCQDYTVRMMRPEGRDFCIPSTRHPRRRKLKPADHRSFA